MQYRVGEKIRAVRERRGFTLKEVAAAAGVSESLVSQIERNRVSPAVDTLLAIADALDIDLEYLFIDYRRERSLKIVRKKERASFTKPGILYERLAQVEGEDHKGIEAYIITIKPGAKTGSTEYGHQGWELGIVISGNVELTLGNKIHTLKPGDSVSFHSDIPHVLANGGREILKVFWVTTPPKGEIE
jgi:transcriptional regulator with XRE-family HTH domain